MIFRILFCNTSKQENMTEIKFGNVLKSVLQSRSYESSKSSFLHIEKSEPKLRNSQWSLFHVFVVVIV